MPRKLARRLLVLALASQAACGAAHVIQRTQSSGVIELEGDHDKAMEQASEQMVAHCGDGNFTIVSDGPEPQIAGRARSWQVRYQCGDGPPPASAPGPAAATAPAAAPAVEPRPADGH